MKDFFKYLLATIVGIIIVGIVVAAVGTMSLIGMVSASQSTKNISDNSVLVLNLSGQMEERTKEDPWAYFMNTLSSPGLQETITAIKKAKENKRVKGIYIESGIFSTYPATAQELRDALVDFKKSGKWIVAYGDNYLQGAYYVASVADKIYINPQGLLDLHGLGATPMYLKDALAKFGIKMQVSKVGKYKSATERFVSDKMSDADREQTMAYLNGIWGNMCKSISESRKISVAQLNALADSLTVFDDPQNYVRYKLVDGLLYTDQVKQTVKKMLKIKDDDSINQVSVEDMLNAKGEGKDGDKIAVYYAYGSIVTNQIEGMTMSDENLIVSKDVCKDLQDLADDDDVKAVVLRVNSPGGSAYASEQIWRQIELLKKKKPVVVSMGGMAASGGYYISSNANWIVAEPTTLTGSIGIFGMLPDFSGLFTQKLDMKFDEVKTNKNTTWGTPARPLSAGEMAMFQKYIDRGYATFKKRVADGRKMTLSQVEAIAQGHVFVGQDAKNIKLVDELGGLDKAISKAAQLAKLKSYQTFGCPAPSSMFDMVLNSMSPDNYLEDRVRSVMGDYYEPFMLMRNMDTMDFVQARMPYIVDFR